MILEIEEITKIRDIQSLFASKYPFLKLAFLKPKDSNHSIHSTIDEYESDTLINSLRPNKSEVYVEIHYWQKTGTVEKLFLNKAGLHVQVLRKTGEHWIETSGSDDLTLEEQNDIGRKSTEELLHGIGRSIEFEKPI